MKPADAHEHGDARDPIDVVRDAWDELPTPPLEHDDATDRAVDAWMNAAWSSLRIPAARPRARRLPAFIGAFAAAALLCIAVGLALRSAPGDSHATVPNVSTHPMVAAATTPVASLHESAGDPRGRFDLALQHATPALAATTSAVFTALAAPDPLSRDSNVSADDDSLVDQAFASNRAGRYREAAAFATLALDDDANEPEDRCAALVNWIHAEHALGHVDEADRLSDQLALALSR